MTNNKTPKIAIFGGSFDPLHFGHIDIVKNLERLFDGVIVVPTYISPFKDGGDDAAMRFKLCKKLLSTEKTTVSRYEISKKGVSYSVDTAAYFKKKSDAELYWVIGSEELVRLADWHDIDRLKTLVTFYVVPRPGFEAAEEALKSLKKRKIKLKFAKFTGLDISSVNIKIDLAFGKTNKFMPAVVYETAIKHGLFDPYAKYAHALVSYGLKHNRIEHSYRTAVRGAELAKLYGASVNDSVIACILHDIGKAENPSDYADKLDLSDYPLPTAHSPIGAYIAKREFDVSDEIAHAIEVHSTGDADMSTLDEIVYLADKTESGRNYASLDHKRYLCSVGKTIAMYAALKEISELRESVDCAPSSRALEYYKGLCGDTEIPQLPKRITVSKSASDPKKARINKKPQSTGDEIKDIAVAVADELSKHKAHDIDIVGLNGKTIIADYFVIASCTSTTAVKALMGYVEDRLTKQFGIDPLKRDLDKEWVALDYGGVIIHIFTDKTREFYNIERLWSDKGENNIERYED